MSSQFSLHNPNNKSVNSSGTYRFSPYIAAEVSVSKVLNPSLLQTQIQAASGLRQTEDVHLNLISESACLNTESMRALSGCSQT